MEQETRSKFLPWRGWNLGPWHLEAADVATRLPRTPPFSRLLRHAGGYSWTILTPNLQGYVLCRYVCMCACIHVCISDIADWMKCNRLQLNSSKSEFIWCSSSRRLKYLDCNPFVIGADAVQPKNEVRDLGLVLDRDLTMTSHITGLVRTSFAILRQL